MKNTKVITGLLQITSTAAAIVSAYYGNIEGTILFVGFMICEEISWHSQTFRENNAKGTCCSEEKK